MGIKNTNIFHSKALKNLPKLGISVYHLATLQNARWTSRDDLSTSRICLAKVVSSLMRTDVNHATYIVAIIQSDKWIFCCTQVRKKENRL
jgi:hypothetical protein